MTDDMATPAPEPPKPDAALSHFGQQVQAIVSALFTMGLVKPDAYPPSVAVCVMDALESHHAQPSEGERLARALCESKSDDEDTAVMQALLAWHSRTKEAERGG